MQNSLEDVLKSIFSEDSSSSNRSNTWSESGMHRNSHHDNDDLDLDYRDRKWSHGRFQGKKQDKRIENQQNRGLPHTLHDATESPLHADKGWRPPTNTSSRNFFSSANFRENPHENLSNENRYGDKGWGPLSKTINRSYDTEQPAPAISKNIFPLYTATESPYVDKSWKPLTELPPESLLDTTHSPGGIGSVYPNNLQLSSVPPSLPVAAHSVAAGSEIKQSPHLYVGIDGDSMVSTLGVSNLDAQNSRENKNFIGPVHEVLQLTRSVLYPPRPHDPPPKFSRKPAGCKTVMVTGLPLKITSEIIREIFERCGEIRYVKVNNRKNKVIRNKDFCEIRFAHEDCVDKATELSGYRISVDYRDEKIYNGKIFVDYIQTTQDQADYDMKQILIQSETRSRERMMEEIMRPPTPPSVVQFSLHEATLLCEKLRSDVTFPKAAAILTSWLEKGNCSKQNAGTFYSMIQSTNNFVKRLMNEKAKYDEEANKAKMLLKMQMQGILLQFKEIGKVFNAACMQKVWDHFTNKQRKNIELWKKQTEEVNQAYVEEVLHERIEDEMDLSEDEGKNSKTSPKENQNASDPKGNSEDEWNKLHEENNVLRCQLEASENEKMVLQTENQELESERRRVQALNRTLQDLTKRIKVLSQKRSSDEAELEDRQTSKTSKKDDDRESDFLKLDDKCLDSTNMNASFPEGEARLLCLTSTFLLVQPCASISSICSYLRQVNPNIQPKGIEALMERFPAIFRSDSTGTGESFERKWSFSGLQS